MVPVGRKQQTHSGRGQLGLQYSGFFISATYPFLKLWQDIYEGQEEVNCERVIDNIQQNLCCIDAALNGLNVHRNKRFKSCITKEFAALAAENDDKSDKLSNLPFSSDLSERMKEHTETTKIARKVVTPEDRSRPSDISRRQNFPSSIHREARRPSG